MTIRMQVEVATQQAQTLRLRMPTARERVEQLVNEILAAPFFNREERENFLSALGQCERNPGGVMTGEAMAGILCLVVEPAFARLAEEGADAALETLDQWQGRLHSLLQEILGSETEEFVSMYRRAIEGVGTLQRKVVGELARGDERIQGMYREANTLMMRNHAESCQTREALQKIQNERKKEVQRIGRELQELEENSRGVQGQMVEVAARSMDLFARGDSAESEREALMRRLQQAVERLNV